MFVSSAGNVGIGNENPTNLLDVGSTIAGGNVGINANLGAELITDLQAANWTVGTGWAAPAGTLNKNASGTGTAQSNPALTITAGVTYKVVITTSAVTVGYCNYSLGGIRGTSLTSATTYTDYITAVDTTNLIFSPSASTARFTISAVSVKALTNGSLALGGNLTTNGNFIANSRADFYSNAWFTGLPPATSEYGMLQFGTAGGVGGISAGSYIQIHKPTNSAYDPNLITASNDTATIFVVGPSGTVSVGNSTNSRSWAVGGAFTGGSFNFNSGVLAIGATGGSVGIGTTSPYAKLSVVGEIVAAYFTATTTTATSTISTGGFAIGTSQFVVQQNSGNVGIGTTSPLFKLAVESTSEGNMFQLYDTDGNCKQDPDAAGITTTCSSDIRLKTDIVPSELALDYLLGLPIRDFTVISSGERMTGVVAQELLENYPELVVMAEDGYYGVKEIRSWKIIKAIQELNLKVDNINNANTAKSYANDTNILDGILEWFKDKIVQAKEFIAEKITVQKLCVGDTCVNEEQLKILLEKNGLISPIAPVSEPAPEQPAPEPVPEPEPTPEPTE